MRKLSGRSRVAVYGGIGLAAAVTLGWALLAARGQEPAAPVATAADPPSLVARISLLLGNVSVEPASVDQFSAAEVNGPLTTGDRIYADTGANAELETDMLAVRLGQATDLTVTAMTDSLAQFGLAQGSVHLRSFSLADGTTVELDTPNVAVTVLQAGDVRVDIDPAADATTVTVASGQVEVQGNGLQQTLQAGQRVRLSGSEGSEAVAAQWLNPTAADGLDAFSSDRDTAYESAMAVEAQDVNPGTIGAADLAAAGDWETDPDEGPVWYPAAVAVGWQPYSCGHWTWVAPWGWTWVECEPWGFAPFHYGRWERRGPRWGWLPGPPVIRPVYAPALVVFVGGAGLTVNGTGVTAWFPLGPHEPYVPWYATSPAYVNRVNVTNIYDPNANRVRMGLRQRSVAPGFGAGVSYANRSVGTVAVSQAGFAAGRPVAGAAVRVGAEQLAAAPVLPHPLVTPQRSMVVPAAARAVPRNTARPELAARPAGAYVDAETRVAAPEMPAGSRAPDRPMAPAASAAANGAAPVERQAAPERAPAEAQPTQQPEAQSARPLYNKVVPPEPRPSFEEQQKAIESTDPGRPLSTEQMRSLRQNQPVQPAQQREAAHPAPAPRPAPPSRPAPPPPPQVKH